MSSLKNAKKNPTSLYRKISLDSATIRPLIDASFGDIELTSICFDHFRPVYDHFSSGIGRLVKIQLLIEYCERQGKLEELVRLVETKNPYQYSKFVAELNSISHDNLIADNSTTTDILSIRLNGDFTALTPEMLELTISAFIGALAGVLKISPDDINVDDIKMGSLILRVDIPSSSAQQLLDLQADNDPLLYELGIEEVKKIFTQADPNLNQKLDSAQSAAVEENSDDSKIHAYKSYNNQENGLESLEEFSKNKRVLPDFNEFVYDVWQALKDWHKTSMTGSSIDYLYLVRQKLQQQEPFTRQSSNTILYNTLSQLDSESYSDAQFLRLRFLNSQPIISIANQLNISESTAIKWQKRAIVQLSHILYEQELWARNQHRWLLESRLTSPSYIRLVGVEAYVHELTSILAEPSFPQIISLEGIGGIGKTAIADLAVRRAIKEDLFDDICWVNVSHISLSLGGSLKITSEPVFTVNWLMEEIARQLMPDWLLADDVTFDTLILTIESYLRKNYTLIVIDGLDTLNFITVPLPPTLQRLFNHAKTLLIARERLYPDLSSYPYVVSELTETDALALIRHEASISNLPVLANASVEEMHKIYNIVGGNPLALRMIVGQLYIHDLDSILEDLIRAKGQFATNLFRYIYEVAWSRLDDLSRQILMCMLLIADNGDTADGIAKNCDLNLDEFRQALSILISHNLIIVDRTLSENRYKIHKLTRTFLSEQAAQWN